MTGLYTFTGADGSFGYQTGKQYALHVLENSLAQRVTRGWKSDWKVIIVDPTFCPYSSWVTFKENWREVK